MILHVDLRAFIFLLVVQLEQFFSHRRGMMLTEARMEAQFEKCCGLGTSWALEGLKCEKFTGPVSGVPTVEQGLCLEAVDICCVRAYHDIQCKKGKADARVGLACVTGTKARYSGPGDYHRDCCEGCKLGILAGSMGQGCAFKKFTFGIPWDPAFLECCYEASPSTTILTTDFTNTTSPSESTETESTSSLSSLTPSSPETQSTSFSPSIPTPPVDDICQLMKGLLCSDICVPTQGSYYCQCREGFTLLEDGKTCTQDLPSDRCKSTNPCEQRCTDNGVAVICSCNPGYVLANDERSCIPKSTENKSTAPDDSNTSPRCPAGYRYNTTNQVCDDVNECTENGLCPDHCENTIGSFICTSKNVINTIPYEDCPPGYQWEPSTGLCTDIDECLILAQPCPTERNFCVNTLGSFSCIEMKGVKSCPAGFKFDKLSQQCQDVDECAEEIHSCFEGTEECRNIEGAYECDVKCDKGFTYSINSGTCIDIDECIEFSKPCPEPNTTCINKVGSFECTSADNFSFRSSIEKEVESPICSAGYKLTNNITDACVDVDECKEQLHSCEPDEQCINEIGSYRCDLLNEKDTNWDAKNEDRMFPYSREYKPETAITVSPTINRSVICETGYIFDQRSQGCIDIDECSNGLSNCGVTEQCINVDGGYKCSPVCPPGFRLSNNTDYYESTEESCHDINECELGLHTCNMSLHYCVNTNGSYSCESFSTTSTPALTTSSRLLNDAINNKMQSISGYSYLEPCSRGYTRDIKTRECVDIDECTVGPGCRDHEQCHNVRGGYECSPLCTTGWYFSLTTKGCQDVDECLLGRHDCPQGTHNCVNTNGSFFCEMILPCSSGFKRFNGNCVDIDECSDNLHNCQLSLHQYCVNKNGTFECLTRLPSCRNGYEYSLATRRCEDIDECTTGQYKCNSRFSEKCINLPGTYRCEKPALHEQRQRQRPACPSGYRYHPRLRKCTDIDECAEGLDACEGEICYNQPGGYSCSKPPAPITRKPITTPLPASANQKCRDGTRFVRNRGCVDIDECHEIEDACSSNEECINTVGSYTCECKTGFRRENLTQACVDINECQLQEDSCLPTQRCDNTIGSYTCTRFLPCGTGYTLNAATEICEDDDECLLGTHDCGSGYHCRNTQGSYRCDRNPRTPIAQPRIAVTTTTTTTTSTTPVTPIFNPESHNCPRGFESGPGGQCLDVDECQRNPNPCSRTSQRCINTMGSYKCISKVICGYGYTLDPVTGQYCVDIDECADNSHECLPDQTCENRIGSYVCTCPPGYVDGPNKDCIDMDECSLYGNICGSNSRCENTAGSFRCTCDSGFENIAGFTGACQDINECERTPGLCQHNCFNTWGSYKCGCKPGFRLNADNRSCTDIDECTEFKKNNLCIGICENTPGSYSCKCPDGYKLRSDGRTCEDIDECMTGSVCRGTDEICHNTRGSFRCNKINCPSGYHQDHERQNRCVRSPCQLTNRACFRTPSHYSYNFITLVSMLPIAPNRPEELFKMRGYHSLGSTIQFSLAFLEARVPPGIQRATESCFALRRPTPNEAVLLMTRSLQGPQEIELELNMELYHNAGFAGSAVAKILIFVSQYEF